MLEMHFFVTSLLKHSCRVQQQVQNYRKCLKKQFFWRVKVKFLLCRIQQHECKVILTCCSNMLSGGVAGGSMCFVTVMGMVFESIATAVRIYLLFSLVVGL